MSLLRHLSRRRQYVCQYCIRGQHTIARVDAGQKKWAAEEQNEVARNEAWQQQAGRIKNGLQQSMLSVLEERGFVKDIAGGRQALDWLLTEKRIGAYVGVDPTAPSLHVGHLLPLMVLYWMYLHGYYTVSLLGGGTVQIGDPSGRTTARTPQNADVEKVHVNSIRRQLDQLWTNVKCLGIKHQHSQLISRKQVVLNNGEWLKKARAKELIGSLGSGMRLGPMLARDSVKVRMESGEGMSISEFMYPLFQAYDWWTMYENHGVQLQIGGSDQYGNICAGMDAVSHMRKLRREGDEEEDTRLATCGLTTPLLTTASGEKFGKSAGNAVWLDKDMMSSFDLYQYFLKTADNDVERYLKLFTFLPLSEIQMLMAKQHQDESKRLAQHILAKEIVELAHGAEDAKKAETAHKDAFSHGTNTFSLLTLRKTLAEAKGEDTPSSSEKLNYYERQLLAYKKAYIGTSPSSTTTTTPQPSSDSTLTPTTLPLSSLTPGSFPSLLHQTGLASSKSDAHRLISSRGAYIAVPNSGTTENAMGLAWGVIESGAGVDPRHFLVDYEALVLRVGKTRVRVVRVVNDGGEGV